MPTLTDPQLPRMRGCIGGQRVDADGAAAGPVIHPGTGERLGAAPARDAAARRRAGRDARVRRFE